MSVFAGIAKGYANGATVVLLSNTWINRVLNALVAFSRVLSLTVTELVAEAMAAVNAISSIYRVLLAGTV